MSKHLACLRQSQLVLAGVVVCCRCLHPQQAQAQLQKIKNLYGTERVYEVIL